ncbi:alpha/beta hydrolase [Succinivibrio dextrinosolvens]|uniref:Esterase n=1 Tax=Succinivibrio dextrinosolvens TaxID=83771 RepID=A0A662ZDV8_9GAMM|nr:alpha/beta hydrolase-fold protein [Succinivibrio dextrinosolvens]SFK38907.1 hypothetical protein SAMN04487865_106511 [Succinivibrio dextrinosolvens]
MVRSDFVIKDKVVSLFSSDKPDAPLILFNSFNSDGAQIIKLLSEMNAPSFNFLNIRVHNWNHSLSPWYCPSLYKSEPPFDGGADEYLSIIENEVIPECLKSIKGTPSYLAISGYSLAGLFALYAICRSNLFSRAASMSGSLWFPDFVDFFRTNPPERKTEKIYLSLGDKESSVRNRYLKTVKEKTLELYEELKEQGKACIFESNPGNHFFETDIRCAKGIAWILND